LDGAGTFALEYYRPEFTHISGEDAKEEAKNEQTNVGGGVGLLNYARQVYDKVIPPVSSQGTGCFKIYLFVSLEGLYSRLSSDKLSTLYIVRNRFLPTFGKFDKVMNDSRFEYRGSAVVQEGNRHLQVHRVGWPGQCEVAAEGDRYSFMSLPAAALAAAICEPASLSAWVRPHESRRMPIKGR